MIGELIFSSILASVVLRYADDKDLIARLQRRDTDAMAELYDRYGRFVFSIVLRIVRDPALAEDLVQEVFLRVWNRAQAFDASRGALGPWVLTISRNQALDYLKSVEGRTWNSVCAETESPASFTDTESKYLEALRLEQVRAAIGKLNESQRRVVELAYFEGLSQTEMAARIPLPLGTVKTCLRGALKILREELRAPVTA